VALRAFMAHPRASPRNQRFKIGPTLPLVRGSRLVAGPLFSLKVSIIGAASWRSTVATGIETGTGTATTFGMVTGAIGLTTPG
jgi:hypothetical protein